MHGKVNIHACVQAIGGGIDALDVDNIVIDHLCQLLDVVCRHVERALDGDVPSVGVALGKLIDEGAVQCRFANAKGDAATCRPEITLVKPIKAAVVSILSASGSKNLPKLVTSPFFRAI